ncbi:MAG: ArsR/SmtB family transcription factor, partial [Candidatus Binatia bacterium]
MGINNVVNALAALAQETRLSIFRLLVEAGPEGVAAGRIAEKLEIPGATLSFHLKELARAGLISSRQEKQFIYYSTDFEV